ncbi:esterase/lipase family protein [Salmonirosea aquatica]|uniref:Alpha/beta fold hydrolase n=1 Tax=Salmonirosea aquatica TaxID=2654236 RepID=A0A7C9BET4_9BACT|nr:alpha/beta fold hydrolase [Cytophagaceae bacterium SJW1-29]
MKHFTHALLLLLMVPYFAFSQAPAIKWQRSLGGVGDDIANSIQQTSDGGYIIAGYSYYNGGDVTGNHGGSDYWIVKLSSQGLIQWQKSLGGSNGDEAHSIQQTSDGGYIVAGFSNSIDGDVTGNHGARGVFDRPSWSDDIWVVKLSPQGQIQWQKSLGGRGDERAESIQQTSDGGYIVAGYSDSEDGDVSGHHHPSGYVGFFYDYWIVKLNPQGQIQWEKSLSRFSFNDKAYSIQQTSDGGYIVAGESDSLINNRSDSNYWVVKLDQQGQILWQKSLGGSNDDKAKSIQQTSDGGYIVAGSSNSNDGDVSGNHIGVDFFGFPAWSSDFWIVKLSSQGQILWQKSLGGSNYDVATSVQQTSDGGYIVAGDSYSNDGDIFGHHEPTGYPPGPFFDQWIVKLDPQGQIQWQKSLGGPKDDNAYSIQQTSDNGYIMAGGIYIGYDSLAKQSRGFDFRVVKLAPDKPALTTEHYHQLPQFPSFSQRKLLSASPPYKIAADGSQASIFKFTGRNFTGLGVRIMENYLQNKDLYGEFTVISQTTDSLVVRYTHPEYISEYPDASFSTLTIELYDLNSPTTVLDSSALEVHQAPLVMVHGLDSNGDSFKEMLYSLYFRHLDDPYYLDFLHRADYSSTNRSRFYVNRNVVPDAILELLTGLRNIGIATGKAIVVGHSMGGILARLYLQDASDAEYRDDIQKLITINTPHSGSQLGDLSTNPNSPFDWCSLLKISNTNLSILGTCDAIGDLSVNGSDIRGYLNGEGNLNRNKVPSHVITTWIPYDYYKKFYSDSEELYDGDTLLLVEKASAIAISLGKFFENILGTDHDGVVEFASQKGGMSGCVTTIGNQHHIGSTDNMDVINTVETLIYLSPKSSLFCKNGFNPPTLTFVSPPVTATSTPLSTSNPSLNLTSPAKGLIVLTPESYNITAEGSELTEITTYVSYSKDSIYVGRQTGNIVSFSFPSGYNFPDSRNVMIVGKTASGQTISVTSSDIFRESVRSGNWDDASTWKNGKIPAKGEVVIIPSGHLITVRTNAEAKTIFFNDGGLTFTNMGNLKLE